MADSLEKVWRDTPVSLKVLRVLTEASYDSILITDASAGANINYKKDGTPFIMYWRVLPIKVGRQISFWVAIQREGFVIQ